MRPRSLTLSSPSFALISVLALVSLAALTATAFLASARLERQATRPLGETARLEMACTSAKECALQTLNIMCEPKWHTIATYWRGTNTNDWTNELGYLLLGRPNSTSNIRWTYFCGFNPSPHKKLDTNVFLVEGTNTSPGSYLTEIGSFMATMTNGFIPNPTSINTNCTLIPLLGGRTSPPVGWTYIYQDKKIANSTNTTNVPIARFSYYMEDLSGLIDAERMGGTTNRATGTNASEISLTNLTTNWSSNSIINDTNYNQFINPSNRAKYFSPALMLYANTNISTNDLRYFAHGLLSWSTCPNTITVGVPINNSVGYSQGGQLKTNLNTSANLNVDTIAATITTNLPNFTNRAGGMAGGTYVSNIAANIVDLFDSDNFATTVGNSVRGIDSYPFVNEIWDQFELRNIVVTPSTTTNWVVTYDIVITTWMELWNISSQPITNGSMSIFYRNREILTNRTSGANDIPVSFTNRLNYTSNLSWNFTNNFLPTNPAIPDLTNSRISPNAFHMVAFPRFTNNVSITNIPPTTPSTKTNLVLLWATNGNLNGYATYFSSNSASLPSSMFTHPSRVDSSSSAFNGIQRNPNSSTNNFLDSSQPVWWRGNATPNSDLSLGLTGDPRIMFHLNATAGQTWWDHSFGAERASWWARNTMGAGASNFTVNLNLWPESGHNSSSYPNTTNASQDPLSITMPAQETNKPVQIIYNTLPANIVQLGQTFDPMQWSYNVNNNSNGLPLTGATAASSSGGGHTLRIGRPEHSRFAFVKLKTTDTYPVPNMGQSAVALLDIFSVSDSYNNEGKINLNTAPAPVLRALAGGVTLTNDSQMMPSATLPVPNRMTEAFAQGVMRFRAVNPFLTSSQLAFIATDYGITNPITSHWTNTWPRNAVFGNTNPTISLDTNAPGNPSSWTTASNGVSEWNDQAAEEWFSKIYNLSSVQSWNYRTYVVAQLVNTNGLPTGPTMRKYSLMYIRYNNAFPTISAGPFISFESPY